eukprot:TRINITY_DN12473_c0_g1_i2.p1 TRINITY_DN12473_c0_g1~~TRINITY_DN12473_c0_g1_i2.p1  ORF type:complete len:269 (-),score=38.72 TRINITY_DN12473_c0_g1_i2:95-901(-)
MSSCKFSLVTKLFILLATLVTGTQQKLTLDVDEAGGITHRETYASTLNNTASSPGVILQKFGIGAPGGGTHCQKTGCIYDAKYCVNKYGQCGMKENEVAAKCGAWALCAGAICRSDYGGYCLARKQIDATVHPTMWGYKKVQCPSGTYAHGHTVCKANVCKCSHGTAAKGTACSSNGAHVCGSCNAGYHKSVDTCKANVCKCSGGAAAKGTACSSNDANICSSCDTGYEISNNTCIQKSSSKRNETFLLGVIFWSAVMMDLQTSGLSY